MRKICVERLTLQFVSSTLRITFYCGKENQMEKNEEKTINKINKGIWGESPLSFYFSYQGCMNRLQFFGAVITLCLFFNFVTAQGIFWLTFLCFWPLFYGMIAAVQKRSRDIGKKGTSFVVIYSLFLYCTHIVNFIQAQNISLNTNIYKIVFVVMVVYLLSFVLLLFWRGKKEKDLALTSPLLKNPQKYFAVWLGIILLSDAILWSMM